MCCQSQHNCNLTLFSALWTNCSMEYIDELVIPLLIASHIDEAQMTANRIEPHTLRP